MLSIGEFSKICRCTAKTLRHYDALGLLKPDHYNPETGYRYYEPPQLFKMLFIQKLKAYGFSLREIRKLLFTDNGSLKAVMQKRYAQAAAQAEQQKSLLAQMKTDIENLEKGMDFMETGNIEMKMVQLLDTDIVSVRETIAVKNFGRLFEKAAGLLEKSGLTCTGAPVAIYHSPDFDPENTDMEIGFPTGTAGPGTRVLKGGAFAMAVHRGSYSNLSQTYARLAEWVEQQGYRLVAPPYERYQNSPLEVPEDQLITEICFPVGKA